MQRFLRDFLTGVKLGWPLAAFMGLIAFLLIAVC